MLRHFLTHVIIVLTASVVVAGCASKNYSTTLRPADAILAGVEARFRINHVDPIPPLIFYMSGFTDNEYWAEKIEDAARVDDFPQQLRALLKATFPERFTDEPEALTLDVRIAVSDFHETSTGSSMLTSASWGIFGIILPLPIAMKYNCEILVQIPELGFRQSVKFCNRLQAWISFPSPLALIPLPLTADRRATCMHPFQTRYYSGRLFTLESFSEAVMQAIAACEPAALNQAYRIRCAAARTGEVPAGMTGQ